MQKRIKKWDGKRLVFYASKADPAYWDEHWHAVLTPSYYQKYKAGELDELSPYIEKFITKDGKILEAGCGPARMIVALRALGYKNTEGIDYGEETIQRVKAVYPDLPVSVGDVLHIDKPDSYYDAYISLGVVEHRKDGPEPFLQEAYRVLKPGGFAFFSVPYINPLRDVKSRLGFYQNHIPSDYEFYQYAFLPAEFYQILDRAGFSIASFQSFAGLWGLRDEMTDFFHFLDRIRGGSRLQRFLDKKPFIEKFGHMILFVCTKKSPEK